MSNNKTSKTLLNETQIRQFMKLAKLEPLTPGFVDGLEERRESRPSGMAHRGTHGRSDKPIPGTDLMAEEEADAEALEDYAAGDEERGHDEEAEHDEMEAADEEGGDDRTVRVDDFLAALERALEDAMGEEVEVDASAMEDEAALDDAADDMDDDLDVDLDDDLARQEDKAYTAKKEKPGADKRKGAEKRGAEGTLAKTKGHGRVDYVNEDEAYTAKKEKPGADKRKGAEKRGAEATKLKHDEPGGRGHKKGDDAYVNEEQGADDREDEHLGAEDGKESGKKQSMKDRRKEMRGARRAAGEAGDPVPHQESVTATDELVEQITKRVAARILKTALKK
jgi:hypothetical protein